MKTILSILIFLMACSQPTPKGNSEPLDPTKIYAYDGNGTLLGTVEGYNKTYAEVRTSKGFLDLLQYNGLPFGKGNEGQDVSPADQNWLFYIVVSAVRHLVPHRGDTYTKLTIVYAAGSGDNAAFRQCMQDNTLETLNGNIVYFYKSLTPKGYAISGVDGSPSDSKDSYFQYTNGNLSSPVQGYYISQTGCMYNEDIGYPPAVDGKYALKAPITLKLGNGTIVKP